MDDFPRIYRKPEALRNSIEEFLKEVAKEPTSLKTVLDDAQSLLERPLIDSSIVKSKKKRKKDARTVRKMRRKWRPSPEEKADEYRREKGTLRGQFHKMRRDHRTLGHEWKLSLDEWTWMWFSCPPIDTGFNSFTPAWKMRGQGWLNVNLCRKDTEKPWQLDNLLIMRGKQIIFDPSSANVTRFE